MENSLSCVLKVVVADDEVSIHALITRFLRNERVTLIHACSESELLHHVDQTIDAVFLDLYFNNAVPSGLNMLRTIRREGEPNLPVCIVSADRSAQMVHQSLICGADSFLCKTDSPELFKEGLIQFLHRVRNSRAGFDSASHFLSCRGIGVRQLELLRQYQQSGFTDMYSLSQHIGCSENALHKQFSRILDTLALSYRSQLIELLTILDGFRLKNNLQTNVARGDIQERIIQ